MSTRASFALLLLMIVGSGFSRTDAGRLEPAPTPVVAQELFRTGTIAVPMDVRVIDRKGRPVTDLTASDFTVLEDGVPQPVVHFSTQTFTPDAAAAAPARPRRAADAFELTSSRRRTFLIVLGRGWLQPPSKGVDAMIHLVRSRLLPQDQVAVLAWNRATDFSADHDAVLRVLERFKRDHEGLEMRIMLWERSMQSWFNPQDLPADIQRDIDAVFGGARSARTMAGNLDEFLDEHATILNDLTSLYLGVEYLRYLAGEKHLVFVSEFGVSLRGVDGDRHLGRLAADARVVLDIIHAGGVPFGWRGLDPAPPGLGMPQSMTARNLARLTGGSFFAHRFPNASMDVDAIDEATRFEYVLGYYPSNGSWDGRYRKIAVEVNRADVTVMHRDGYFARRESGPLEPRNLLVFSRMASAAAVDRPIRDVGVSADRAVVTMSAATGQAQVDMTIDLSRVAFEKTAGVNKASLEVAVFCGGRGGDPVGESWQTLELAYSDDRLAAVRKSGLTHTATIPVTGLPQQAKVVVYDYGSDLVGTTDIRVTRAR